MLGSLAPALPGASRPARGAPSAAARLAAASSAVVASAARISSPQRKCSELGRKAVAVLPCCGQLCELRHREAARLGSAAVCVASGCGALVRCARGPRVVRSDSFMRDRWRSLATSDLKDLKVKAHSGGSGGPPTARSVEHSFGTGASHAASRGQAASRHADVDGRSAVRVARLVQRERGPETRLDAVHALAVNVFPHHPAFHPPASPSSLANRACR
jgi:hypothetical protein